MTFKPGDRVQASTDDGVGTAYRGLAGTVVANREHTSGYRYLVNFDNPPEGGGLEFQGGYWNEKSLESVPTPEEIEAAICEGVQ